MLVEEAAALWCKRCDGRMETELVAVYPDAEVCLDCMDGSSRRRLEADLCLAQEVNRWMLPHLGSASGRWDLAAHYRSSRILSGDFYDLAARDRAARLWITLGDVAGKGIPAGLLRASLQATLRAFGEEASGTAALLEKANGHFFSVSPPARFASVFHARMDRDHGGLVYASAGHLPALVRRTSGRWESLDATGPVLGIFQGALYKEVSSPFEPGDLLIVYSDGVTEASNGNGSYFEAQGIMDAAERSHSMPARVIVRRVVVTLERFSPGLPDDDRTLLVVRRPKGGEG